jgi:peptidoglycan hydrolase-like protein with peptidoglycan-binding domain
MPQAEPTSRRFGPTKGVKKTLESLSIFSTGAESMKMRHIVAGTSAALISIGALAGGEQQSSTNTDTQSATVRQAQERLASEGFNPGAVDGKLGRQTQQGLKDFQQAKGLEPSGQLDPQTIAALGIDTDSSAAAGGSSSDEASPETAPSSPERTAAPDRDGGYSD